MPVAYEFFAGGGMARLGLGQTWQVTFANDISPKKAEAYRKNFGGGELLVKDVAKLSAKELPGYADLAWASFPCQDLSLAGAGGGLQAARSGTFWPFWRLMQKLADEGRSPKLIVLENVYGAVRSHQGRDFAALADAFATLGYRFGPLLIDAVHFVPQSRLRLFIIGVRSDLVIPSALIQPQPEGFWRHKSLIEAYADLPKQAKASWLWWRLPPPPPRQTTLMNLIEEEPRGVAWRTPDETAYLLGMMSKTNLEKVEAAKRVGERVIGTVYKRMRSDGEGGRVQRAEVRFDGVSGCLRTPSGGSSRQTILVIEGESVRSRLLSPREAARLMGLPETYWLPNSYNDAYHLAGDGVVAPVVSHLADYLLEPVLAANQRPAEVLVA